MLRAIIGFDHIVKNVNDTWIPTCGYWLTKTATATTRSLLINSDGALSCSAGNSTVIQGILDFTKYLTPPIANFTIGFRVKQTALGNSGAFVYLASDPAISATMTLLNFSSLPNVGTLNSEVYVEMSFDLTAGTVSYWLDEVFLTTVSLTGVSLPNLRNGLVLFAFNLGAASTAGICSVKDIYLTDNIAGDGYTGRIGPRVCKPITVDVATGTDWTVSDGGTILNALNAAIETGTATVTSGPSKAPLVASLKADGIPVGANVEGIMLSLVGKTDNAPALTGVKLTNGSKTINGVSKAIGTTQKYGNPMGAYARAPDGSRWTAASIDSTTVSFTPDVAS
jgi:hypothetical protein